MLDALETASALTASQRERLVDLAHAREALPWALGDERLQSLMLVRRTGWLRWANVVEINGWGWAVALHVSPSAKPNGRLIC